MSDNRTVINFPFAGLVGSDALRDALIWLAVDPGIGGVLVTGTRGTAKSTAVRALADLMPPIDTIAGDAFNRAPEANDAPETIVRIATPFVELPVGATEDRVIGTLDVRALLGGERRFDAGLLARANRGVLYVDEVNLLPDHLVDVILDAAATGRNVVERDGASLTHDARIVLVGTMNPEEGELRPQLLDRFGLCVAIASDDDLDRRVTIVERRLAFERDPAAFVAGFAAQTEALRARVADARVFLPHVSASHACVRAASVLARNANVEGMRADLTIVRTARAIAAFDARREVTLEDIERAAEPALAHRRREAPRTNPPRGSTTPPPPPRQPQAPPPPPTQATANGATSSRASALEAKAEAETKAESTTEPRRGANADVDDVAAPPQSHDTATIGTHAFDGRAESEISSRSTRARRFAARGAGSHATPSGASRIARFRTRRLAALATLRVALMERPNEGLAIVATDARYLVRRGRERQLVLFLIDASGSMAAAARMRAAKGVVCALLADAYRRRDAVALVAFRGDGADVLVPPTRSAIVAYRRLRTLPTGGRTPLASGLASARELLVRSARRDPGMRAHLVVVTDARANAPAVDAIALAFAEAAHVRALGVRTLCVDTEGGVVRLGLAQRLATVLDASYRHLDECSERALGATVREWMATA